MPLTLRQQQVLDFLREFIDANAFPPTLHEIRVALKLRSVTGVTKHIHTLEREGQVEVLANTARGIRLVGHPIPKDRDTLRLPLVGEVAAGEPILSEERIERYLTLDRRLFQPKPHCFLRVRGHSMTGDGILHRDLIGVHLTSECRNGQIVVARVGNEITVKHFEKTRHGIRLLPRSEGYGPINIDPIEDFAVVGLYCGLVRMARS